MLLLLGTARWTSPALQRACVDLTGRVAADPLRSIAIAFARVADWLGVLLALWFAVEPLVEELLPADRY